MSKMESFDVFHIGLLFQHSRRRTEWLLLELVMDDPTDLLASFIPNVRVSEEDEKIDITWRNRAKIRLVFSHQRPQEYENFTPIGYTNGEEIMRITMWIRDVYVPSIAGDHGEFRYDVFTFTNGTTGDIIRRSRSCFELVQDVLSEMRNVNLVEPKISYWRDSVYIRVDEIRVHANPFRDTHESVSEVVVIRSLSRFLRIIEQFKHELTKHVVHMRIVFSKFFHLGIPYWFGGFQNDEYWEILKFSNGNTENVCRSLVVITRLPNERMKVESSHPDDPNRNQCLLPFQSMEDTRKFLKFNWFVDFPVLIEDRLDRLSWYGPVVWVSTAAICIVGRRLLIRLGKMIVEFLLLAAITRAGDTVGWFNRFDDVTTNKNTSQYGFKNHTILNDGRIEIDDNNLEKWNDNDIVEVYLGDYPLQNVELSSMLTFTVYHMGVIFQNPVRRKWYVVDFFARTADTIANIIMPSLPPYGSWYDLTWYEKILGYLRGDIVNNIVWDNNGYVRMIEERNGEFNDLKHVGSIYAKQLKDLRQWLISNYTAISVVDEKIRFVTFDMWSVYDAESNIRLHESRNCHDFVEHVLRELNFHRNISPYEEEIGNTGVVSVFRDSLSLSAKVFKKVDIANNAKKRRDFQRFLRFMRSYVYEVTRDLALSRYALTRLNKLGLPFIFKANGDEFYQVEHGNVNSLNYCRVPMDFIHDKPYTPSLWNDTRKTCYFPFFEIDKLHSETPYSVTDFFLMIEQRIDDALFGEDGLGVPLWDHLTLITETTLIVVAIGRAISWLATLAAKKQRM